MSIMDTDNEATSYGECQKRTRNRAKSTATKKRTHSTPNDPDVAKKLESIPKLYRGVYKKAMSGKSLRAATHAQCLECVCWQRLEVAKCTSISCPLYNYRPYQEESEA